MTYLVMNMVISCHALLPCHAMPYHVICCVVGISRDVIYCVVAIHYLGSEFPDGSLAVVQGAP